MQIVGGRSLIISEGFAADDDDHDELPRQRISN